MPGREKSRFCRRYTNPQDQPSQKEKEQMKHIFTVLAIAGLLVVAITVTSVTAQTPQPGSQGMAFQTPLPQSQQDHANSLPAGWSMGKGHGMVGSGGMMAGRRSARGGTSGSEPMNYGPGMLQNQNGTAAGNGWMMAVVSPMHEDVAQSLGMTSQNLYNQMAEGKSMGQIAAEQGISEQQLMNSILTGRQMAYGQAVRNGYMTQAQGDAMYQNLQANIKTMVNGQGNTSAGWNMMWEGQPTPQANR
jgi:hypothetical protein